MDTMKLFLGKDWQQCYPQTLSEQEKAEIRSALLRNFQNGNRPLHDMKEYLQAMKLLETYPTHRPD